MNEYAWVGMHVFASIDLGPSKQHMCVYVHAIVNASLLLFIPPTMMP